MGHGFDFSIGVQTVKCAISELILFVCLHEAIFEEVIKDDDQIPEKLINRLLVHCLAARLWGITGIA